MAFFLAVLLDNPERNVRLVAALFLIVFAQIREISLVNDAGGNLSKRKKKKTAEKKEFPKKKSKREEEHKWSEKDKHFLRSFSQSWRKERARI